MLQSVPRHSGFLAAALLVALLVWVVKPFSSEEDKILAQLEQIESELYLVNSENKIQFATRVAGLVKMFTEDVEVSLLIKYRTPPSIHSRDDLKGAMLLMGAELREFDVNFYDTKITLGESHESATVTTAVEINYQQEGLYQASDMTFHFVKNDGDWYISEVTNSAPLEF